MLKQTSWTNIILQAIVWAALLGGCLLVVGLMRLIVEMAS
jgi:hypothetical protein